MKKKVIDRFKCIFVLILVLTISSCSSKQEQQIQAPTQKVNVVSANQGNITNYVEFVGQVYGYQDIEIRARVDGFLEGIHFNEGFPVKKGQLLYTIDSQPYEAEVSSFRSKVTEAKTALVKADSDLKRYKPLAEANAISKADLDAKQAEFEAAQASVEAAEANLEISKIKLSYTKIKSPTAGIIGKTQVKVGEYVGKMPAVSLNTVSLIDQIIVEFFLPENQYLELMKVMGSAENLFDKPVKQEKNLELFLADGNIHESKGFVSFLDRAIDSNTGALLVQTLFENPKQIVKPGQYAKVRIPIELKDAVTIPQKCVIELQGQYSVFVVGSDDIVESRKIVPGIKSGDLWIIDEGLNAGEKVIIDGIQKVRNGVAVEASQIKFESVTNPINL